MSIPDEPLSLAKWNPTTIKILCVDDEATARLTLKKALANCGYSAVSIAKNGREALEMLDADGSYQLILSDLHMPEVDGMELIKQVRKNPKYEEISIVLMSATEDLGKVFECMRLGADDYIIKPIQTKAVKNVWSNVFRKHKEREFQKRLSTEQNVRKQKDIELKKMSKKIKELKNQFSEAVDTPIDVISRTIVDIQKQSGLTEEVQGALSTIVKALNSSDLYRPALNKLLKETGDEETMGWLQKTLSVDVPDITSHKSAVVEEWPAVTELSSEGEGNKGLLRNWDFDVWAYEESELLVFLEEIFLDFDLGKHFDIPIPILRNFLLQIRANYSKTNPYHNFRHAFDVTQAVYFILAVSGAHELLTHTEIFALLIAACCHDLDHPGLNNSFQIQTDSSLALQYNDKSVLENHHASLTFQVLRNPAYNILVNVPPKQFRILRKIVVDSILATDLGVHMEKMTKFNAITDTFTREKEEHRQLLCEMILKCADISNPARPGLIAAYWSDMIQEEIFQQGDEEKLLGLSISPFMDREDYGLPKMSVNFIKFLVLPLYTSVAKVLPGINFCCDNLITNQQRWQMVIDEQNTTKEKLTSSTTSS